MWHDRRLPAKSRNPGSNQCLGAATGAIRFISHRNFYCAKLLTCYNCICNTNAARFSDRKPPPSVPGGCRMFLRDIALQRGIMHYYQFNIADFNNSTRHLSRIERSIYRDLIDLYYDTESPLTTDLNALCRKVIATSEQERTAVEQVLNEFFEETGSGWVNTRCEIMISEYKRNLDNKSKAGKASANARKYKKVLNKPEPTGVEQPLNTCATNHKPLTINHKPIDIGEKAKRFSPPTHTEVMRYCLERSNDVDPDCFIDHYTSNGWLVGKNKMKDWKAAVRTWEKRNGTNQQDTRSRAKRVSDELDRIAKEDIEENGFTEFLD